MEPTTEGPIGTRSGLRMSGTKTENRVPAWASSRHFRPSSQSRLAYESWSLGSMVTRSRGRAPRSDSILAVQRKTTPPMVLGGGRGFRLQPAAAPARTRVITHSTAPCISPVRHFHRIRARDRGPQPKSSVATSLVVVFEPLGKNALEMAAVEDQDPVQAFAPSRTDLPLDVGIGLGRHDRRPDHLDTFPPKDKIRAATVLGVVIVDQEPGVDSDLGEFPAQVPRLLAHPQRVRPLHDREPDHPPGGQLHI